MINEKYPSHSTATGENKVITDDHRVYTVRGAFYRVNYDYKGKYLFETNGRYDGSSKFPKKIVSVSSLLYLWVGTLLARTL